MEIRLPAAKAVCIRLGVSVCIWGLAVAAASNAQAQSGSQAKPPANIKPDQIQFRRQAVRRMVFDRQQAIPLASMSPAHTIDLDLMHPESVPAKQRANSQLDRDLLVISSASSVPSKTQRWIGGLNPFATYDVDIESLKGTGSVGVLFSDSESDDALTGRLLFRDGKPTAVKWQIMVAGKEVDQQQWPVPKSLAEQTALTLRVQLAAVGANLVVESKGKSHLLGFIDYSQHIELRERSRAARYEFALTADLLENAQVKIRSASSAITTGVGQADIRAITDEQGQPLLDDGRLWFTMTTRGRALPHPAQGVFSLNPSVFDLRFEGLIVFDSGDGLLRNELASHLFRDTQTGQWRGWTTGFSAFGNANRKEKKTILAVSSERDPRKGYSVMKARPIGIEGGHEDPHCVYDAAAKKWRLLLCENAKGYKAAMWESDHWDRGFQRLTGPVDVDSTGTLIQRFGDQRYVLFGSKDRTIYVRNYPDLTPAGELKIKRPPWNDGNGTRVWPNVIPLPEGYPAPYIALMMDRVNFPNMPKRNWTYGAMYLYHGHPINAPGAAALDSAETTKYTDWTAEAEPVYQEPDFDFVKDASISKSKDGLYYMYYTGSAYGFHGGSKPPWRLDYATSQDGIKWDKRGTAFPAEDDTWEEGRVQAPSKLIQHDGKYWMFYAGGPRKPVNVCKISCATSTDLKAWTKRPDVMVTHTNEGVNKANDPFIYKEGDLFYLFYTTYPRGKTEAVFYRTSRDLETWSEPVSTGAWGEGVVIWKEGDTYYLLAAVGYSGNGEEYHCFSGKTLDAFQHHGPVKLNTPAFAKSAWGHGDILLDNEKVYLYFQGSKDAGDSFQIGRAEPAQE